MSTPKNDTILIDLPQLQDRRTPAAPPGAFARGTETILVIEYEAVAREYFTTVLRELGYTVLTAASLPEAVAVVRQHRGEPLDLVLTDLTTPVMGGAELAERLAVRFPGHKMLYCAELPSRADRRDWERNDNVPFLPKPFTAQALANKVREVLDAP